MALLPVRQDRRSSLIESLETRTLFSGYTASLVAPLPTRTNTNFNAYSSPLVRDPSTGTLYGFDTAGGVNGTGIVFSVNPSTKVLTVITTMQLTGPEVIQQIAIDSNGNIFGLSLVSAAVGAASESSGAELFELAKTDFSTPIDLYTYPAAAFSQSIYGSQPVAMIMESNNNLDVLTSFGGTNNGGVVDQFLPGESYATPHNLGTMPTDYHDAVTNFTRASDGTFFILTAYGAANSSGGIFKLPSGESTASLVASFNGTTTGTSPQGLMYADANDDVFGTVSQAGPGGYGGVWEYNAATQQLSVIAPFTTTSTGVDAVGGVVADSTGNLYGTTTQGGGGGSFFKVDATSHAVSFTNVGTTATGNEPFAPPVSDGNGNFFITTLYGAANSAGAVVEISPGSSSGGNGGGGSTGTGSVTPTVTTSTVPATAVSGIKFKGAAVTFTVSNSGSVISKGNTFTLYASTDGSIDSSSVQIGQTTKVPALKAGKSAKIKESLSLLSVPAGTYSLLGKVTDSTGSVTATTTGPTLIVAEPFVSISAVIGSVTPGAIAPGKSGSFTLTLTNLGNIASAGLATIAIGLSTDGIAVAIPLTPLKKSLSLKVSKPLKLTLHFKIAKTFANAGTFFPMITVSQGSATASAVGSEFSIT